MYNEGKARIKHSDKAFLNPIAKFMRDVSIAFVAGVAGKSTKILDATTATGIRGIRYYLETESKDITLLDINEKAYEQAKKNASFNKVKAKVLNKSIQEFANTTNTGFEMIDLDPFGGISPYVYDLMKLCRDGTYFMLTATDGAVLCGAHTKACLKLYDAQPMHNELCQETGIRIMIGYVARVAAQFDYGIDVIMALSQAHYMRVFLKLKSGADAASDSVSKLGYAYYCGHCGTRYTNTGAIAKPPIACCEKSSSSTLVSGKMWLGRLYDKDTVAKVRSAIEKADADKQGMRLLDTIIGEYDVPLHYSIPKTTKQMGVTAISPIDVMNALKKKGFEATRTQFGDSSLKTNASMEQIRKIISTNQKGKDTK